jgi:uncharacterized RDD family membrane protein YckC
MPMEMKEEITEEGYRLAPFLLRLSAWAVDLALTVAAAALLYLFLFPNGNFGTVGDAMGIPAKRELLNSYQIESGLVVKDSAGNLSNVSSSSYEDYEAAIEHYYFVYDASSVNPNPHHYSAKDFNVAVLNLPESAKYVNNSAYFDFAETNGVADESKIGVLKSSLYDEKGQLSSGARSSLLTYFQNKYKLTQDLLLKEDYYVQASRALSGDVEILEALIVFVPSLIFYFAIPMFSPLAQTLGKKWMKIAVIDVSYKPLDKWRLILRYLPLAITAGAAILLDDLILSLSLALLIALISMGIGSFTPKRRALHDYCAHSVVVRQEDAYSNKEAELAEETNASH